MMSQEKEVAGESCSCRGESGFSEKRDTAKEYETARAHAGRIRLVCAVFLGFAACSLLLYVDSSLAKLVEYNRSDLLMLSCEILTEAGPWFQGAAKRHVKLLREYKTSIEQRHLAGALTSHPLYSKYSPQKGIDAALSTLNSVDGNDIRENAVAVWKAGEQLMHFHDDTTRLFRPIGLYWPGRMPDSLLEQIEDANDRSGEALANFRDNETLLGAWKVCECNRDTVLLLFVGRSGYDYQKGAAERFQRVQEGFRRITGEAAKIKDEWAKALGIDSIEGELVKMFAQSEDRRCRIVQAMLDNKMSEANRLMLEAIERSIQNRERVLEMALELKDKTQNWEQLKR